jgi:hypothetical protein
VTIPVHLLVVDKGGVPFNHAVQITLQNMVLYATLHPLLIAFPYKKQIWIFGKKKKSSQRTGSMRHLFIRKDYFDPK